jgi:hypothetical protein
VRLLAPSVVALVKLIGASTVRIGFEKGIVLGFAADLVLLFRVCSVYF